MMMSKAHGQLMMARHRAAMARKVRRTSWAAMVVLLIGATAAVWWQWRIDGILFALERGSITISSAVTVPVTASMAGHLRRFSAHLDARAWDVAGFSLIWREGFAHTTDTRRNEGRVWAGGEVRLTGRTVEIFARAHRHARAIER
jgi:hypothetical protein